MRTLNYASFEYKELSSRKSVWRVILITILRHRGVVFPVFGEESCRLWGAGTRAPCVGIPFSSLESRIEGADFVGVCKSFCVKMWLYHGDLELSGDDDPEN